MQILSRLVVQLAPLSLVLSHKFQILLLLTLPMLVVSLLLQLAVLSLVLRPKTNYVAAEPAAASYQSVSIY